MPIDALLRGAETHLAVTLAGEAAAYFKEDWRRLGYIPLGLLVAYGLLRPASVRPSGSPALKGAGTPAGADGTGGSVREKAVRVSRKREPAPKLWAVPELVPHGPVPRRRWPRFWEWEKRGYITCVLGSGGVGKSYVLLDLALAALDGGRWLGRDVGRVPAALYVDTELDAEECGRRAWPLARGRGHTAPPEGLHYLHLRHSLASDEGQALVSATARRVGAGLILVDSLTIGSFDVAAADANGWNRVYTGMERWGVPVVAIDHLDKAGRGAYGSMMKQAKVRSLLQLALQRDGSIRVEHAKSNFGRRVEPFLVYPEFGDVVRFPVEPPARPSVRQEEPSADAPNLAPKVAQVAPNVAPVAPLRLVPRVPGRDGLCQAVMGFLKTSPPPEPWTRPVLRDAIVAAKLCNRGTAYGHLAHLLEDGLLTEGADGLRLRRESMTEEKTA